MKSVKFIPSNDAKQLQTLDLADSLKRQGITRDVYLTVEWVVAEPSPQKFVGLSYADPKAPQNDENLDPKRELKDRMDRSAVSDTSPASVGIPPSSITSFLMMNDGLRPYEHRHFDLPTFSVVAFV